MTLDVSKKVALPTFVLAVIGAALLIVGAIVHDESLRTAGYSVLGASGIGFGVGYSVPHTPTAPAAVASADDPSKLPLDQGDAGQPDVPPDEAATGTVTTSGNVVPNAATTGNPPPTSP